MERVLARSGETEAMALRSGWIGAGKMGAPMARRLLSAGVVVSVTELDADARKDLAQAGAAVAADLSVQDGCDIVFSTLPTARACRGGARFSHFLHRAVRSGCRKMTVQERARA